MSRFTDAITRRRSIVKEAREGGERIKMKMPEKFALTRAFFPQVTIRQLVAARFNSCYQTRAKGILGSVSDRSAWKAENEIGICFSLIDDV